MIYKMVPFYLPVLFITRMLQMAIPFIGIIMSARIIDQLTRQEDIKEIMNTVIWMTVSIFFLTILSTLLNFVRGIGAMLVSDYKNRDISDKAIDMDYDILERKTTMDLLAKAEEGVEAMGSLGGYSEVAISLITRLISIVAAILSLSGLFVSVQSSSLGMELSQYTSWQEMIVRFIDSNLSSTLLFLAVGISVWLNSRFERKIGKIQYDASMEKIDSSRVYWFSYNLIFNYVAGKDIRLFRTDRLIEQQVVESRAKIEKVERATLRKVIPIQGKTALCRYGFFFIAYLFMGLKAIYGVITVGQLTQYIGMILLLQDHINGLFSSVTRLVTHNTYLKNYVKYREIPNQKYEGSIPVEQKLACDYTLEFRKVSFHYPNNEKIILKDVSFKLKSGKKLAIVGQNGAGKTTFIKLLCRLYDPTEGSILLNGIDIREYDYKDYLNLFSVVFQDFKIFSFSVAENVASSHVYDEDRVWNSLEKAGLKERVMELPKGIHTKLLKDQQDDGEEGIEISGGERQKIALARALYREASIVILDEPTSALDPLAEQDIYERFNDMVQDKTAIFISHRMSSCKFCDEIIVFDNGEIVEAGNHQELLLNQGLYSKLWNAQAQYYQ